MELWTITYIIDGEQAMFQRNGNELEDNFYSGVVNLFLSKHKAEVESGRITSYSVSYTRHYEKVDL